MRRPAKPAGERENTAALSPSLGTRSKPTTFPNAKPAGGGPAGQNTIRIYFGSFTPTRRKCQGSLTRPVTAVARPSCPRKRFAEHTATALEDDSVTLRSASTALNERNTGFVAAGREMTWLPELDSAGRAASASVACAPEFSPFRALSARIDAKMSFIATAKALRLTDEDDWTRGERLPDGRCCAPSSELAPLIEPTLAPHHLFFQRWENAKPIGFPRIRRINT